MWQMGVIKGTALKGTALKGTALKGTALKGTAKGCSSTQAFYTVCGKHRRTNVMLSRHTTPFAHSSPPAGSVIVVICAVCFNKLRLDLSQAVGWASPSNGLVAPLLAFPKWKSNAFV
ncbi:hypothetical protein SDJN03_24230, partial [Cucurbita argyrosperma subsp. sororia]